MRWICPCLRLEIHWNRPTNNTSSNPENHQVFRLWLTEGVLYYRHFHFADSHSYWPFLYSLYQLTRLFWQLIWSSTIVPGIEPNVKMISINLEPNFSFVAALKCFHFRGPPKRTFSATRGHYSPLIRFSLTFSYFASFAFPDVYEKITKRILTKSLLITILFEIVARDNPIYDT